MNHSPLVLDYIELPVHLGCNLKCKGCSHFSNILPVQTAVDYDQFCRDIKRLHELIPFIRKIRLLGGEPLLNDNIDKFVSFVKEYYPDSCISVVTNGLMIPALKQEILMAFRFHHVKVSVSSYPPTIKIYDKITCILQKYGISYEFTEQILTFRKRMCLDTHTNPEKSFMKCTVGKKCHYLFNGRISVCSAPSVVKYYNEYFNMNLDFREDMLDIHDSGLTGEDVIQYLHTPMQCCRYCGTSSEFPWTNDAYVPSKYDWMLE